MRAESIPADEQPAFVVRRVLTGAGVGSAVGAAGVSVAAAIAMWSVQETGTYMALPLARIGAIAIITAVAVVVLVRFWLLRKYPASRRARIVVMLVAGALAAWGRSNLVDVQRSGDVLTLVDTSGTSVFAVVALVSAIMAIVVAVVATLFGREVSGRVAVCAFAVVALVGSVVTYTAVQNHRAGVWHPSLTAAAAPAAPVPDVIGPVGYRIPLKRNQFIYTAGNGFLLGTSRELAAYDGATGQLRWRTGDYGVGERLVVARRDRDDATGVVVVFFADAVIGFDGSSGDVVWRRQIGGGRVTSAAGSVDALGMSVFTGDYATDGDSATRFYSLDPATGQVRWDQVLSCSSPSMSRGTAGQLSYDCGRPVLVDARSGDTVEVPGRYVPMAGTDAYVVSPSYPDKEPAADESTRVMDPAGQIIDEVPSTYPVSRPHDGLLLLYGPRNTWLLRDYRNHRSTPVVIHFEWGRGFDAITTLWLGNNKLLVANQYDRESPLQLVDLARPGDTPATPATPCPERTGDVKAVAGAILVECRTEVVGLVPEPRP